MHTLTDVESVLQAFCSAKIVQADAIDKRYGELWKEINGYLKAGGKRMRPRLVLLAYDAYNSAHDYDMTQVAAAWELLHACLLVHDDIIDRDTTRHGQPNIAGRYQQIYEKVGVQDTSHYALSAALLGGDLLLMSAYEMIATADIPHERKHIALSYINQALFTVAGGELIDTDAVLYPITDSDPYEVAAHKTASYSLQLPLQCGASLAGASADELDKLSQIGFLVGVAYQLQDDLLGVFGDSVVTGKSNRSDILEKKRTALIHRTIAALPRAEADRIIEVFAPDHTVSTEEAEEIVHYITSSGAKELIEQDIAAKTTKALAAVEHLAINDEYKQHLTELIEKLTVRTH